MLTTPNHDNSSNSLSLHSQQSLSIYRKYLFILPSQESFWERLDWKAETVAHSTWGQCSVSPVRTKKYFWEDFVPGNHKLFLYSFFPFLFPPITVQKSKERVKLRFIFKLLMSLICI